MPWQFISLKKNFQRFPPFSRPGQENHKSLRWISTGSPPVCGQWASRSGLWPISVEIRRISIGGMIFPALSCNSLRPQSQILAEGTDICRISAGYPSVVHQIFAGCPADIRSFRLNWGLGTQGISALFSNIIFPGFYGTGNGNVVFTWLYWAWTPRTFS